MEETTKQEKKWNPNPEGKGGFQDHPELRNNGGRVRNPMKEHIMKRFKEMTDEEKDAFLAPMDAYKRITLSEGHPRQDTEFTGKDGKDLKIIFDTCFNRNAITLSPTEDSTE